MLPITMMTERRKAGLWKRMKSMRVSAGTRWKGLYIVSASKRQQLRPEPAQPERGHEPRHVDRGEERGDDADQQRDRETLDRARAELEQEQGGDDERDVGVQAEQAVEREHGDDDLHDRDQAGHLAGLDRIRAEVGAHRALLD